MTTAAPDHRVLENELIDELAAFAWDPLGFVMFAYPWSSERRIQQVKLPEPWASRYGSVYGPDAWACELLDEIGEEVQKRGFDGSCSVSPIRAAVSSGHGIGKGAFTAWLTDWIMSTRPNARGVITANTGEQLRTKTWAEITKWTRLSINAHWWELSSELWMRHRLHPEGWRVDGITWDRNRSEAFAGLHEASSTPFYINDEGSAIDDVIYEVQEGGLTDGEPMQFIFGNPTRSEGKFYRVFHKERHRWITRQVDSRTVQITNKAQIAEWQEDSGDDSDFFRVRVRGVFPRMGINQFIASDMVAKARTVKAQMHHTDPVIVGLDVAREGGDESVICARVGLDARTVPWRCLHLDDTMDLVGQVAEFCRDLKLRGLPLDNRDMPAAIFVDIHGVGGPVYDRLRQLGYPVHPAYNVRDQNDRDYAYTGGRWWGTMREWLALGGAIPDDEVLASQLTGRRTKPFDPRNRVVLEKKDEMRERIGSPDRADALAFTFVQRVPSKDLSQLRNLDKARQLEDYDPFAQEA